MILALQSLAATVVLGCAVLSLYRNDLGQFALLWASFSFFIFSIVLNIKSRKDQS